MVAEEVQDLWRAVVEEESGDVYFWNTVTDETSWERPPEMLRVSTAKDTKTTSIRSVKGDVTNFGQVYDKSESEADDASASMPPPPLRGQRRTARKVEREGKADTGSDLQAVITQSEGQENEWDPSPEVVLDRCAEALGMKDGARGILAVRRECLSACPCQCLLKYCLGLQCAVLKSMLNHIMGQQQKHSTPHGRAYLLFGFSREYWRLLTGLIMWQGGPRAHTFWIARSRIACG